MKTIEISIENYGTTEKAIIGYDRRHRQLSFKIKNGPITFYSGNDLYECFGALRAKHPDIIFLCKGAKLNVHPSRVSSQMTSGLVAYELKLGITSEEEDLVRIFDYENENLTNNIEEQRNFYGTWLKSLDVFSTQHFKESHQDLYDLHLHPAPPLPPPPHHPAAVDLDSVNR